MVSETGPKAKLLYNPRQTDEFRAQNGEENVAEGYTLVRKGGLEPPRFYPPDPKFTANEESTL
jgi:hypothetical protein